MYPVLHTGIRKMMWIMNTECFRMHPGDGRDKQARKEAKAVRWMSNRHMHAAQWLPADFDDNRRNENQYYVRGCTAFLDAIGGAIHHIDSVHRYKRVDRTSLSMAEKRHFSLNLRRSLPQLFAFFCCSESFPCRTMSRWHSFSRFQDSATKKNGLPTARTGSFIRRCSLALFRQTREPRRSR